ncbi:MAG TPA: hypothetical protein VHO70_15685 [Chitinispirillaceae bacterium]|nr:hypothetical protein [Chitinispirillaceae bacterium]
MKVNNAGSLLKVCLPLAILFIILLLNCAMRDGTVNPRLNPLDPLGDQSVKPPPAVSSNISISKVWSDYSFHDSTGSLQCSLLQVFKYVTIDYGVYTDSLLSVSIQDRMVFEIDGFKNSRPYIINFKGYLRNGEQCNEQFIYTTPSGTPPFPPTGFNGDGKSYGVQLRWNKMDGAQKYSIMRIARSGFTVWLPLQDSISCSDFLPDYNEYTYNIGSVNEYGTAYSTEFLNLRKITSIMFPQNCTASSGLFPDHIMLHWDHVSDASSYRVYRSTTSDGVYAGIAVTADTLYRDSTGEKNFFYYRVASINDSGYTGRMGQVTIGYITDSLDIPDSLNATKGVLPDKIMVFWNLIKSAASYNIYKTIDSAGVYTLVGTVPGTINFYTDSSITRVADYYYKVSVVDTNGIETEKSLPVSGSVKSKAVPENVSATQGSNLAEITVSWDAIDNADRYFVYRSYGEGDTFSLIGSTTTNAFHDTTVYDTAMYYKINCLIDGIEGEFSNVVAGWIASHLIPVNLTASLGTYSSHIELQWRPVSGAVLYIVYRADNYAGPYLPIESVDSNRYDDATITTDDYYFYRVAALAPNSKLGTQSEYVQGFADAIGRPMNVTATTVHPKKVYVRWNAVKDAQYYIAYRQTNSNGTAFVRDTISDTLFVDSTLTFSDVNFYYSVTAGIQTRTGFRSATVNGALLPPPLPVNVSHLENGVYLRWNIVKNANHYKVYRSLSNADNFNLIDSTVTSFVIDSSLDDGTYYYKVSSCSDSGENVPIEYVSIRNAIGPEKLNGVVSGDTVKLSWSPVSGVSSYYIYRAERPDSVFSTAGVTADTLYRDTGPMRSGDYYYYVRGYIPSGSFYTSVSPVIKVYVKVKPLAPVMTNTASYNGYIRISWTPNTAGTLPYAYILYRTMSSSGIYSPVDTINGFYYNDSVPSTSTYYYKVSGLDSTGEGALSSYITGYAYSPEAPAGESISWEQYPSGVMFKWKKNSEAISYIVYRAATSGGARTVLDTVSDTSFFDTTIEPSSTGYYSVRYLNLNGLTSYESTEMAGKRLGPPISISVLGYANHIRLNWSGISNSGIYYKIYRSTSFMGPFTVLDSTYTFEYNDTVSSLAYYYYKISSVKNGESQVSTVYSGRLTTPSAPVMISASMDMITAIHVVWNSVAGAQTYKLYRSTSSSFSNPVFVSDVADTFFLDTVPSDSIYYFKCKSVSIAGESSLSSVSKSGYRLSSSPPPVPMSLYVSDDVSSQIYMYWSMPSSIPMVAIYKVYRSEVQSGPFQVIDSTSSSSYIDYVPKTYPDSYWYYITSSNLAGESAPSDTVSGYRP